MQSQKTDMGKRQFRIGDLSRELHIKKFVIRFWEREFGITSDRSQGGQRFYTDDDLATFQTIKHLLYEQGFTIAGAKKHIQSGGNFMPCTQDVGGNNNDEAIAECSEQMNHDTSTIVPATTDYEPQEEVIVQNFQEHESIVDVQARVRQEVLDTIAPIKAKLLHLKTLLD